MHAGLKPPTGLMVCNRSHCQRTSETLPSVVHWTNIFLRKLPSLFSAHASQSQYFYKRRAMIVYVSVEIIQAMTTQNKWPLSSLTWSPSAIQKSLSLTEKHQRTFLREKHSQKIRILGICTHKKRPSLKEQQDQAEKQERRQERGL